MTEERTKGWKLLSAGAWLVALALAALAAYLGYQAAIGKPVTLATFAPLGSALASQDQPQLPPISSPGADSDSEPETSGDSAEDGVLPSLQDPQGFLDPLGNTHAITRFPNIRTIIPDRPGTEVITYTVDKGDSVFEIATSFNVKPETVLWANYDQLNDDPDMLELGMDLRIPPVNGVLYTWKEGDTLESVAGQFQAQVEEILNWSGNGLDLANPVVQPGALVMVPGGKREFRRWIIPTIPRGRAGVSMNLFGTGSCDTGTGGALGSGYFVWPAGNHTLSGNDYWDGHLAIDIAAGEGAPIYAADSGVVVFAGWATGGYGNMVMIDHGNGYQTLYAHMSSVRTACGASVGQGGIIGYSGSTGNSTGAHLHFEVRYFGGFVSPWFVLPAP